MDEIQNKTWTKRAVKHTEATVIARPERSAPVQTYIPAWLAGTKQGMKAFFVNFKERVLGHLDSDVTEGGAR